MDANWVGVLGDRKVLLTLIILTFTIRGPYDHINCYNIYNHINHRFKVLNVEKKNGDKNVTSPSQKKKEVIVFSRPIGVKDVMGVELWATKEALTIFIHSFLDNYGE